MAAPTVSDLSALLGRSVSAEQGGAVLSVVTMAVRAYVRGGPAWEPNEEQAGVILTAAARLCSNPSGLDRSESVGPQAASWRNSFQGFTLGERITLDRYRITAR
jgi:hypothetical protein